MAGSQNKSSSLDSTAAAAVAALAATPLFAVLEPAALDDLARQVERVHVAGGHTLMREGEEGDCLFVVVSGRLGVFVSAANGRETGVAEVGRGETVGEMAVLTGSPRSATVRALRDSILLRFTKSSFDQLLERSPQTTMQLARVIVSRLEDSIHGRHPSPAAPVTIAVVAGGSDGPASFMAALVVEQLAKLGSTLHLSSSRITERLTSTTEDEGALVAWLAAQEAAHGFVVYECDARNTPWTQRCLRQADRVILAARASSNTTLSEVEESFLKRDGQPPRARVELVIVHDATERSPSRAAEWRAGRTVAAHHHIRRGSAPDAERLGRLLIGRGVGVVLSGGGARGFAHLGVLRALEECGVPIDAVGGSSMGAIVGGLLACGYTHAERMERCITGFAENPPNGDFTLPMVALNHGRRGNAMLRGMYGDATIENLWMTYFCVSTNLTRAETRVARDGPMWKWILASCSAPGLAPPVVENGSLLMDGGILDNLPVGVMRATPGIGVTVASDVGSNVDVTSSAPEWDGVSGWAVLWQRLRGGRRAAGIPSIVDILLRTATISSVPAGREALRLADLYISPPAPDVKVTEWKAGPRVAESSYHYALDRITEWKDGGPQMVRRRTSSYTWPH